MTLCCPILSSCYSQRIKTWGKKDVVVYVCVFPDLIVSDAAASATQSCPTGLSAYHSYFPAPCPQDALFIGMILLQRSDLKLLIAITKSSDELLCKC